jgi:uncharacterized membrane protein YqjE
LAGADGEGGFILARRRRLGLFDSAKMLLATPVAIAHNRLELLLDRTTGGNRPGSADAAVGAMALFLAVLGIAFLALLILIAFWDDHRLLVASVLAVVFVAFAIAAGLAAWHQIFPKQRLFDASLTASRRTASDSRLKGREHPHEGIGRKAPEALVADAERQRMLVAEACWTPQGAEFRRSRLSFLRSLKRRPLVVGLGSRSAIHRQAAPGRKVVWLTA